MELVNTLKVTYQPLNHIYLEADVLCYGNLAEQEKLMELRVMLT